ncbi:uncharacterized protein LOC111377113 [Olea europaea var. sylvestris]|uniref:uncharacterized protein LOC111377113 n=1 Tax=Olea europaea var. sylvestris TaxID=158386 RepID=UPI000C1D25CE|nr:uncharacterized protein LOC111377113 [Olea europaea var. sylvestris]
MANGQNNPIIQVNEEAVVNEGNMLVGDFMTPQIIQSQSSIVYPLFGQPNFQLKTNVIHLFQNGHQFYGRSDENPHIHVSQFLEMCQHFKYQGISDDAIKLRLFPHTLRDRALEWLDSQPIASITTWNDLAKKFCTKFFPPAKITKLKHDISIFGQGETESFEAWNRFKNMLWKCPHHGINKGLQVQYFYAGLLPSYKSLVDSSSNGSLSTKTIDEALELFESVATTTAMWASKRVVYKKVPEVYEVDTYTALSAKIDSLVHKVESMSQSANVVQAKRASCEECGVDHSTLEEAPEFSWSNQNLTAPHGSQFQQAEKRTSLEEMFGKFMEKTDQYMNANNQFMRKIETTIQNQSAVIKNLETQMGQMAEVISGRAPCTLPSNTEVNPKEHVKAITTRSGVQLPEFHVKRPTANKEKVPSTDEEHAEQTEQTTDTSIKESSNTLQVKEAAPIKPYESPIPFPQRLQNTS